MQRSGPKMPIVPRMIGPFAVSVHGRPGRPSPEILIATFGCAAASPARAAAE